MVKGDAVGRGESEGGNEGGWWSGTSWGVCVYVGGGVGVGEEEVRLGGGGGQGGDRGGDDTE